MLRFCPRDSKIVQTERDRCTDCDLPNTGNGLNDPFLSGPFMQRKPPVVLPNETTLMNRFRIEQYLNNGKFGSVYLAVDLLRSNKVALKVTEVGPQYEEIAVLHLQWETEIYSKISNFQNVIKVYDLHFIPWNGTGLLALSLEFATGGTFRKWLLDHKNDLKTRQTTGLDYFKQACRGMAAIHQANVTHLDLKPENLLFLDSILKVSDLGAAIWAQLLQQLSGFYCETLPSEFGTPAYMSPEHFTSGHPDDLDARADIYSLGIILFELLNPKGRPPFGGSYRKLRELHLEVAAPRLTEAGEKLADVIARCLEKNPSHRYKSVEELLDDLEERPASIPLEASTEKTVSEHEETWERASLSFSEGDFKEATRLTEEVLEAQPNHTGARKLKEELSIRFSQAEQFYQEIARNLEAGDLPKLTELLKEAINIYPDHPAGRLIQAKLNAKARQYRNAMEEGIKALQEERWESALEFLREALKLQPKVCNVRKWVETLTRIKQMRQEIDQAVARGEFKKALRLARSLDLLIDQLKRWILALKETT